MILGDFGRLSGLTFSCWIWNSLAFLACVVRFLVDSLIGLIKYVWDSLEILGRMELCLYLWLFGGRVVLCWNSSVALQFQSGLRVAIWL